MPERIQRRMTKNWRKPEGAVYVGRPGRWGNPWTVVQTLGGWCLAVRGNTTTGMYATEAEAMQGLMKAYATWAEVRREQIVSELAGKDLMCWCPLVDADGNEVPCHATVLLELAAGGGDRG